MARAHNNTVQNGMCSQQELGKQDARLNKAYQALMAQYKEPAKKLELRDGERSWLKQRDYSCKIDGNTVDDGCLMEKTAARADELEKQAEVLKPVKLDGVSYSRSQRVMLALVPVLVSGLVLALGATLRYDDVLAENDNARRPDSRGRPSSFSGIVRCWCVRIAFAACGLPS